jgi:DNA-binding transcriptional MerR regulator
MARSPRRHERTSRFRAGSQSGRTDDVVFTIRDLARDCDVTARTLRFYEEKGLLTPRRVGQERLYSRRDRARLKYVLMGRRVGFSLDEVRELLDLYDLDDGQETQLRVALARFGERTAQLERQKSEIEWIINELRRASQTVANMLEGRSSEAKPRVRMRAARRTADDEDARRR